MKIVDLTHTIHSNMPVYPGTEPPLFTNANSLEEHGFIEKKITMFSHTGTHMDAPSHILSGGKSLDAYGIEHFLGTAYMIVLQNINSREISLEDLRKYEAEICNVDYLILNTGWCKYWGSQEFFTGYPILSQEAATWLSEGFSLKGIGTDAISIDYEDSLNFPIHKIFFKNELVVIENLNNLDHLKDQKFQFCCFPLKTKDADGAPIRAIAVTHE